MTQSTPSSRVSYGASLSLIAVGVMVLVGWTFDVAALKGVSGAITMKANAAVGLIASGVALWCVVRRKWYAAGRSCAVLAGLVGVLTLSQHIVGWNLGIDQLLFTEAPGAAGTASPGRMGPNTSLNLAMGSIALLCLFSSTRRGIVCAQLLAACMATLALVPTVGYLYGARSLYAIARYTGIAPHTGVALLILSAGILTARGNVGPVAALTSNAAHGMMARRLLVPAIALPLVLGYVRLLGERRGWYDTAFGAAMFVTMMVVLLSVTIWHTAVALARSDVARQTAEEALTETEQRFRSMADQAPVLIWVEESDNRVWFNKRWFEFTGAPAGTHDWEALIHSDDLAACRQARERARRSGEPYAHQYRLRRADGQFAWVLETASPRLPARGTAGYIGSCIDVTELRQAQQDREESLQRERAAREKAERADQLKEEFIAALSHELRTPLNAILGWMHMLQHATIPEEGRSRAIDIVARNAVVLARLIEDLLDTSRITTGQFALSRSSADLRAVVQAAVESFLPEAERKGVDVSFVSVPSVPLVNGDAQRLQQVVWNLLSNAIKFSPSGGRVEVRLSVDGDAIALSVRDNGEGIDPAFLPHVFDRFRQADSSTTRAQSGLGLGLYIAKHITALHGGDLQAHSEGRGCGAVFTIRLPASAPVSGVSSSPPASSASAALQTGSA